MSTDYIDLPAIIAAKLRNPDLRDPLVLLDQIRLAVNSFLPVEERVYETPYKCSSRMSPFSCCLASGHKGHHVSSIRGNPQVTWLDASGDLVVR